MQDCNQREIDYLRISLTSNCNLRCQYCMPAEGIINKEQELSSDELIYLIKLICQTRIKKIRLTGGEPLLYPKLDFLIKTSKKIKNIEKVVLTTNGILLAKQVESLKYSGLDGINLSLDCVDKDLYKKITRGGNIDKVLEGIEKAKNLAIPLKINSVIMKDINEQEILPLVKLANYYKVDLRFIELMPMNVARNFKAVTEIEIKNLLEKQYGKMSPLTINEGPAHYYSVKNLDINIGFISALSHKFCMNCNRIRLTATGILKPCLHYNSGVDLRNLLKNKTSKENILRIIQENIYYKPKNHHLEDKNFFQKEDNSMSLIGG